MKWLFIIDPLEKLNPYTDTTYAIMKESCSRGIDCFIAEITNLSFDSESKVNTSGISFKNEKIYPISKATYTLDDFNIVFMRKDPPYDLKFHYATQILSLCNALVVNNPQALRDFNEKMIILNFPALIPKTIVASDEKKIINFVNENETAVFKSLDSYQGRHVCKVSKNDRNIKPLISEMTDKFTIPIMVQEFIPKVYEGDKRILVLGGKIIGAISRIPKPGSFLSNFWQGGKGVKTELTIQDKKIADSVSKFLVKNGIHFAGLDVIDGFLTEVNITCPTGVRQINAVENAHLEKEIADYFEKVSNRNKT